MTLERWQKLCKSLQIASNEKEWQSLLMAWDQPHRAYHSQQHLQECLQHLDSVEHQLNAKDSASVEIALWYHDAIYEPLAKDNERQSADWAMAYLEKAGASLTMITEVENLIMVTCHNALPQGNLQQVMVDIDLAILGADKGRYAQYSDQVQIEYAHIPTFIYRYKRKTVLKAFLGRDRIYQTDGFNRKYEQQARTNLKQEIARL